MKRSVTIAILIAAIMVARNVQVNAQCVQCDSNSSVGGNFASALGMSAIAAGQASFAVGLGVFADGNYSLAMGKFVSSYGANSVTIGRYLQTNTSPAMIIGTGYDFDNKLSNNISNSLMVGFNSGKSTLFVGGAPGNGYTGKIGIGNVIDPQAKLHIKADNYEAAELFIEPHQFGGSIGATLWLGTKEYGLRSRLGKLEFKVGNNGSYLFNEGMVGIGTIDPHAKLQVTGGDVFIEDISKGIIMKSPSGQCWRATVSDDGNFILNQIDCPGLVTSTQQTDYINAETINIFPNPTTGVLAIETGQEFHNGRVSIFSIEGRQVLSEPLNNSHTTIDLGHLQPGVYIVNIEGGGRLIKAQQVILK